MDIKPIVAMCAVIVALTSVAGLMTLAEDWEDMHVPVTDTINKIPTGWEGRGQWPDLDGDERKHGEVFQTTQIFTSYDAAGNSEQIAVGGHISFGAGFSCDIGKTSYEFYIWDLREDRDGEKTIDGVEGWFRLSTDVVPTGKYVQDYVGYHFDEYTAPAFLFMLDGLYEGGATIQVRFRFYCEPILGLGGGWITAAVDEARLIRGDGELVWDKERYTVGVDDYAKVSWFVPGIQSEVEDKPVYKLFITHWGTGEMLYEEYVTKKSGVVKIALTEDMVIGEGDDALVARLWNAIFQKDVRDVPVTIKGGLRAIGDDDPMTDADYPQLHSITTDKAEYDEGELATIYINATMGRYPISHYSLLCEIEGTEVVPLKKITTPTYQAQVSIAGILHCDATVWDIYGNPSLNKEVKATVMSQTLESWCLKHPDDPACKEDKDEMGVNWYEGLIIGLAMLALLLLVALELWGLNAIGLDDWRVLLGVVGTTLIIGMIIIGMLFMSFSTNGLTAPVMPWDSWW